jgi:hypothetical protein
VIADPFERTAAVLATLRSQIDGKPRRRRRGLRWLSRPAEAG